MLGIESYLNADEHIRILDAVDSPAVQVYYDVANMNQMGYDIYREIRQLGRDRICQIHCKENGYLLGQGKIDFQKVKEAIDEIGWQGWLVIEGGIPEGGPMHSGEMWLWHGAIAIVTPILLVLTARWMRQAFKD